MVEGVEAGESVSRRFPYENIPEEGCVSGLVRLTVTWRRGGCFSSVRQSGGARFMGSLSRELLVAREKLRACEEDCGNNDVMI